jgi:hypothetical protein
VENDSKGLSAADVALGKKPAVPIVLERGVMNKKLPSLG